MIKKVYQNKIDEFFGERWIQSEAEIFLKQRREKSQKNLYNPDIPVLEKKTHPLVRDVLSHFKLDDQNVDLNRLTDKCKAELEINLLGRDLNLLWEELKTNENILKEYQRELSTTSSYDSRRFELFVAAAFKLQGFSVTFIERRALQGEKTPEFIVQKKQLKFNVECKQRYQREPDSKREKFLYLLTADLFPKLLAFNLRFLVVEIFWNGNVEFEKIKDLSTFISSKVLGLRSKSEYLFEKYRLILTPSLPSQKILSILDNMQKPDPSYVTTADAYIATHEGLFIFINRDVTDNTMENMNRLVRIAKTQVKSATSHKAIYLDVGTLPTDAISKFGEIIKQKLPEKVDMLVILKHQLHIGENREILFVPSPEIIWNRKLLSDQELLNELPGFIGDSGFDHYIRDILI